jgi:hypothetical protein
MRFLAEQMGQHGTGTIVDRNLHQLLCPSNHAPLSQYGAYTLS